MEIGEVYVSLEKSGLRAGGLVLVVIQPFDDHNYSMAECLVLLDETGCSLDGPGSTDEWSLSQLRELFERIV